MVWQIKKNLRMHNDLFGQLGTLPIFLALRSHNANGLPLRCFYLALDLPLDLFFLLHLLLLLVIENLAVLVNAIRVDSVDPSL